MFKKLSILLLWLVLTISISTIWGQIPQTISYQGVLTDVNGKPVTDGIYNMTFKLYLSATGSELLWSEKQTLSLKSGIFNVILGKVTPLNLPFDVPYWLGITVDTGIELTPRIELTAAAYSLNANSVADSVISGKNVARGAVVRSVNNLTDHLTLKAGPNVTITSDQHTITISATSENNGWTISGNNLHSTVSGNIGIGTTNPETKFQINTGKDNYTVARFTGERANTAGIEIENRTGSISKIWGISSHGDSFPIGMFSIREDGAIGSARFVIVPGGNIGIGTTNPAQKLDISGTAQMTGFKMPMNAADNYVLTSDASGVGTWKPVPTISGNFWALDGNTGTNDATNFLGTTDNKPLNIRVNNTRVFRFEPNVTSPNIIGGFSENLISTGIIGSTISGGGSKDYINQISANYSTIGGGNGNQVSGVGATVGGGERNIASGKHATVGGGVSNSATGLDATVGGGGGNVASGKFGATIAGGQDNFAKASNATVGGGLANHADGDNATVPGGFGNKALGKNSFAAGYGAIAQHTGSFVWSDDTNSPSTTTGDNQFLIMAAGGVGIGKNNPGSPLDVAGTIQMTGFKMPTGATNNYVLTSDGNGVGTWKAPTPGNSGWVISGNNMYSTVTGNVGIGINNPVMKLDVSHNGMAHDLVVDRYGRVSVGDIEPDIGNSQLYVTTSETGVEGGLFILKNANNTQTALRAYTSGIGSAFRAMHVGTSGDIAKFENSSGAQMTIKVNGNVGIGNSNPREKVEITDGALVLSNGSRTTNWAIGTETRSGFHNFYIDEYTGARRFYIKSGGNVGIGRYLYNPSNILTIEQNSATDPIADAWTVYSSRRWKTNIQPIQNALDRVKQLQGVRFDWKETGKSDIGLIAEEVGKVIPEVVAYEENGVDAHSVDYARLVSVLIEGMKEQQKIIEEQQKKIDDLIQKFNQSGK
ncbi:tail fiber domain-containing protein [candidate division KSB1 bacterium]|nr:tail fiber domain-containing protein [candidate division KSB1 bacterium]